MHGVVKNIKIYSNAIIITNHREKTHNSFKNWIVLNCNNKTKILK